MYVYCPVSDLRFAWDPRKANENSRRHGVTFGEAQTVFLDENALLIGDPDHSDDEDRFVMIGLSARLRVLVVCHCYRTAESEVRLITARKGDREERREYERRMRT